MRGVGIASSNTIHVFSARMPDPCFQKFTPSSSAPRAHSEWTVFSRRVPSTRRRTIRHLGEETEVPVPGARRPTCAKEFCRADFPRMCFLRGTSQVNVSPLAWDAQQRRYRVRGPSRSITANRKDFFAGTVQALCPAPISTSIRNWKRLIQNPLMIGDLL